MKIILQSITCLVLFSCGSLAHAERNYSIGFGGGFLWVSGQKISDPSFGQIGSLFLESYTQSHLGLRFEASWMKYPNRASEKTLDPLPDYRYPLTASLSSQHAPEMIGGSLSFILFDKLSDFGRKYILFSTGAYHLSDEYYDETVFVIGPGLGLTFGQTHSIGLEMSICAVINDQAANFIIPLRFILRI